MMRNAKTGATRKVSRDYLKETFWFEPQGNLRHIRKAFEARDLLPNWYQPGRINRAYQRTNLTELSGSHYGAGILTTKFQGKP